MEKRGTRITIALSDADLSWLDEIRDIIKKVSGTRPPSRATLLSNLIEAVRQDDQDHHAARNRRREDLVAG
jgi:hypothetical protein